MKIQRAIAAGLTALLCVCLLGSCKEGGGPASDPSVAEASRVPDIFEDGLFGDDEATASGPQASGGQADTPSGGGQTHTASSGSQTSSKPQAGDTSSRPTNSGTQNLVGNTYTSGFPIVKDKVTLKILTYSRPAHAKDWDSMYFSKKYEEKTNIHIDWSVVPQSSILEQTKIMLQTQSYPDILIVPAGVLYDSDVYTYGTQNVLWDSSQSLKTYAPNLYDLMKNDKTIRMSVQQQNGSIYSLPYINYDYPGAPGHASVSYTHLDVYKRQGYTR